MSGEYYCNQENVTKYHQAYDILSPNSATIKEKYETKGQDPRLHEIEEQLEMAEDRCNTLKGQLDYMKQVYGVSRKSPKIRKISNISPERKIPTDAAAAVDPRDEGKSYLKRQNSNAIGTDNTGAAVRTINNILNGITDSVNRLSELHVQVSDTPRNKRVRSTGVSPHPVTAMKITSHSNNELIGVRNYTDELGNLQNTNPDTFCIPVNKPKNVKKRNRDVKPVIKKPISSQQSLRRSLRPEKRIRNYSTKTSTIDRSTSSIMKRRVFNGFKTPNTQSHSQPHKLVEIYHNIAARNSDSDEGNLQKSRGRHRSGNLKKFPENHGSNKSFQMEVPPIEIPEKVEVVLHQDGEGDAPAMPLETIRSMGAPEMEPLLAPRTEVSCYCKNYELPTIASRMKQVAKSYLNSFAFKAIPFCAAISTSPSHNIGINIQQVMNIIKNRQPIRGISPTLAHNIGLAAERLNSRPLSAIVSTIHSKTGYRISQCPLTKAMLNYPQLQEMARGIPEETAEEVEEEIVDSPEIQTIIITGPSGDMEVKNRNAPKWIADPTKSEECTCAPQSGVDLQHVVNKYKRPFIPGTSKTLEVDNRVSRYSNINKKRIGPKKSQEAKNGYSNINISSSNSIKPVQPEISSNPLQGKEKNLKEVLTNLHDEFEVLNKKYEELANKASAEDEDTLKELEKMEMELNKKEEEITMVMTLYKEVIALKQQVKNLKEKTSQASVNVVASDVKFKEYNNPQAAFHLTKLLRQIQHYQIRYKKEFSGV